MDHTFVEHAENDVHRDQRSGNQQRLVGERRLKRLRGALEAAVNRRGQADLVSGNFDASNRVPERQSRRKVEGERHRWKLALMRDHQRHRRRFVAG